MYVMLLCSGAGDQLSIVSGGAVEESRACSLYMREFDEFVSRAANAYLTPFICTDFIIHRSLSLSVCLSVSLSVCLSVCNH